VEYFAEGSPDAVIDDTRTAALVDRLLNGLHRRGPLRRVLLVPPDVTRLYSGAGRLTCLLYERLRDSADVVVLPAVGTHTPMTPAEIERMFPGVPAGIFRGHDWRNGVAELGEVPAGFVREVSEGKLHVPIRVEIDRLLIGEKWDAILSIGQLVPHEVIGIANHNKNVLIGAGGSDLINKSHYLGAVYGMERIMGRARSPVRDVLDYASDRFLKGLPITYLLTVRARAADGRLVTRGLFAGDDNACFRRGAALCRSVNLDRLDWAPRTVVVYLDPLEFKST
jgi:nickel-dependent lactate racemase